MIQNILDNAIGYIQSEITQLGMRRWGAQYLLVFFFASCCGATSADVVTPQVPLRCDMEWDRIKSIPPMPKNRYEAWLRNPGPQSILLPYANQLYLTDADMYYYMARVPAIIGEEQLPTIEQRDEWLQKAAESGHKAAKAALMRLRYLGLIDMNWLSEGNGHKPLNSARATREDYLEAARLAAEAGDPEFASVMMDTSRDTNGFLHCQRQDRTSAKKHDGCNPQKVTQPTETRRWAEIAAQGGDPNAKSMLCRIPRSAEFAHWGFENNGNEALLWCFAAEHTACLAGQYANTLASAYERDVHMPRNLKKASEMRFRASEPVNANKRNVFPYTTN